MAEVLYNGPLTQSDQLSEMTQIGEGGFGLVYRAQHKEFGKVAYKKLSVTIMKDRDQ